MKFQTTSKKLLALDVDLVAIQCFGEGKKIALQKSDGGTDLDRALDGQLSQLLAQKEFGAKEGETFLLPTFRKIPAHYILVLGAGNRKTFGLETLRKNGAKLLQMANEYKLRSVAGVIENGKVGGLAVQERTRSLVEGVLLSSYRFNRYQTDKENKKPSTLENVWLCCGNPQPVAKGIAEGEAVGQAVNLARTLTDLPPNVLTPTALAKWAQKNCSGKGITCKTLGTKEIKAEKMGGILGVSQGSVEPPAFIHLHYKPAKKSKTKIALVGKGITFDSGGLNIKTREMEAMKMDMAGSASVIGTFSVLSQLKPDIEVHGFIASSENMPSGTAVRPSDIITMRSGKTVEILNTDAEGRLVLADALDYCLQFKPDFIVDAATLTGGTLYALGEKYTSVLGNNDPWIQRIVKTGKKAGEPAWQLPLIQDYKKGYKKGPADLSNISTTKASTISGALFLEEFVGNTKWAHMDIAGTAWVTEPADYFSKGATGTPVRTFLYLLMGW